VCHFFCQQRGGESYNVGWKIVSAGHGPLSRKWRAQAWSLSMGSDWESMSHTDSFLYKEPGFKIDPLSRALYEFSEEKDLLSHSTYYFFYACLRL
jgi:hypothetical protein